ncbi:MAG: A/G-specific adenine glycosylase [Desulfobacteraceae bacterium]|nr:A/G-specific adenine glycosylase [Desulfobacteraceae bacterium]
MAIREKIGEKTVSVSVGTIETIRAKLLSWFEQNGRSLPWRGGYEPYAVWISEMMLQQTRIKTALPFFIRWMERFPDPGAVARAHEDEVLQYWEGLGYYARAKNIHLAAKLMVSDFNGKLPRDFESVRSLPGIGRYTAGAIMSIAYNDDYPAVDANVARILSRMFDIGFQSGTRDFQDAVWRCAAEVLPKGRARDFNQGLMDFGSLLCLPKNPACGECPVAECCLGFGRGVATLRPVAGSGKNTVPVVRAIGIAVENDRVLVRKRPPKGLMPNLYEFPGGEARDGEDPEGALKRAWKSELGLRFDRAERLCVIKHSHTSFRVTLHVFLVFSVSGCGTGLLSDSNGTSVISLEELDRLPFPAAHRKAVGEWKRAGEMISPAPPRVRSYAHARKTGCSGACDLAKGPPQAPK